MIVGIIAAACLAGLLLLGGCGLLIVAVVDEAEEELDERSITLAEYESVKPGATELSVRERLGEPTSEESFTRPRVECIYYPRRGEGLSGLDDFRFCFRNEILYSKGAD